MPLVGFELTISVGEQPKTYTLDRAATGIGTYLVLDVNLRINCMGRMTEYFLENLKNMTYVKIEEIEVV
jgi:hypothetical protein